MSSPSLPQHISSLYLSLSSFTYLMLSYALSSSGYPNSLAVLSPPFLFPFTYHFDVVIGPYFLLIPLAPNSFVFTQSALNFPLYNTVNVQQNHPRLCQHGDKFSLSPQTLFRTLAFNKLRFVLLF